MLRGEIWLCVWPNDPKQKPRPLLIISNNLRNQAPNLLDVIVIKLTSLHRGNGSIKPINEAEDFVVSFKKPTIIRAGAIFTIEKSSLTRKVDHLSISQMNEIEARLKNALDLHSH